MRITSWKYRLQLPGFELPDPVRLSHQEYDDRSAVMLEDMANRIEGNPREVRPMSEDSFEDLEQYTAEAHVRSFITLLHGIHGLTTSLADEFAKDVDRTE